MRERGLLLGCATTYNGVSVQAAKENIGSPGEVPPQAKTRVWGSRGFSATRTGGSSSLSPMLRLGCGHVYDETASARLVYPNGLESQFTLDSLNRVTSLNNAKLIYDACSWISHGAKRETIGRRYLKNRPRFMAFAKQWVNISGGIRDMMAKQFNLTYSGDEWMDIAENKRPVSVKQAPDFVLTV